MCGISGIARFTHHEESVEKVRVMNRHLTHRGPDAEGLWSNDFCVLGHRRLSIIDTSAAGNQPLTSEDQDLVIVFNGEIYNYLDLRRELESGYPFSTQTDTEVILAAYRHWGPECVQKLAGMFAFALWDGKQNQLLIARDRLGIKPLYYAETPRGFVFASELRAVLATDWIHRRLDREALADYLRYQTVHAPHTIIEGVHMLMPGHRLVVNRHGVRLERWWDLVDNREVIEADAPIESVHAAIHQRLVASVEEHMRADVPFGAFLSGGIDSSIIVGLMSRVSAHPVNTFSLTFREPSLDESRWSRLIAKRFHTRHTEIPLAADRFRDALPEVLAAMDHPSGDGPNTHVVAKATREAGIKMALSGLGGDEVFAGYPVFRRLPTLESRTWIQRLPLPVRRNAGALLRTLKPSVATDKLAAALAQERLDLEHLYPLTRQVLASTQVRRLLKEETTGPDRLHTLARGVARTPLPSLSKISVLEMAGYMQNVLLRDADQMSMAHGLELRVPFLDHRLVAYVLSVSDRIKYPHSPKQLLTDSVGSLIPREIIDRPKMGFSFPWDDWMRNELRSFCEDQLASLARIESLHFSEVMALWKEFLGGSPRVTSSRLWPLVVLGHWVKQHQAY